MVSGPYPWYEVLEAIEARVRRFWDKIIFRFRSMVLDLQYWVPDPSELVAVARLWAEKKLPGLEYVLDRFDCDDFAASFKAYAVEKLNANAVGIALGEACLNTLCFGHAWNIAVVEKPGNQLEAVCIEPQTGEVFDCTRTIDGWEYYLQAVII